jgi:uncharacterized caspase-like protein
MRLTGTLFCLLLAVSMLAQPGRRAVIIGIDDYSASKLPGKIDPEHRGWAELRGAARDAETFQAMLQSLYGFSARDIVLLTNQNATRSAILRALDEHLVKRAQKGDVLFFYFAGHGSQRLNSKSDESDKLDETIVPADSRRGAPDISDKELRRSFNAILDRGAMLTIVLDHCHSGSSFRGLPSGAIPRGIAPSRVDIADATDYGPLPESRGALVFSATQADASAWETRGDDGLMHGVFSWSLIRALRDALPNESAHETFLRARARMRTDAPDQQPNLAGPDAARKRPFLGSRMTRVRGTVAIASVEGDQRAILDGGWIHGLSVGTPLRGLDDPSARLTITKLGLASSEARIDAGASVRSGMLFETTGWVAPPARPMRVCVPRTTMSSAALAQFARKLAADTTQRGIRWITDPTRTTPTHVVRASASGWEVLAKDGTRSIRDIPRGASLFLQLPATFDAVGELNGIEVLETPLGADYVLAGRFVRDRIEYAWLRPHMTGSDWRHAGLPQRTQWITRDAESRSREAARLLRRIHAWHSLESPPPADPPYRLTLERERTGKPARDQLMGDEIYRLILTSEHPDRLRSRYYYAFMLDRDGKSYLIYPRGVTGSVENRFPLQDRARTIRLSDTARFRILPPYGVDTYFLLSTDEQLANPSLLEWDGVRTPLLSAPLTPLEEVLLATVDPTRGVRRITTGNWTLEKIPFRSTSPRR